jgi:hypothetical protein
MSWGHRRRQQNIRDYSSEHAMAKVRSKMLNRWKLLAPMPITPMMIYMGLFNKDEIRAILTLRKRLHSILREDNDIDIQWDCDKYTLAHPLLAAAVAPHSMRVGLPVEVPLPKSEEWRSDGDKVLLSDFPDSVRAPMVDWSKLYIKQSIEYLAVEDKVSKCFSLCNTMGQVKRVWPNLCSFLPDRAQEVLRNAKVQSRYPDGVLDFSEVSGEENEYSLAKLNSEWEPAALVPYDMLITEALVLTEADLPAIAVSVGYAPRL